MQQPKDFIHFQLSHFPEFLVDLYRNGFKWATFNHLEFLEFQLWLSQGNWQSGYYLEINSEYHNWFDAEDEIHNFKVHLLEDGSTDGWFPPYQFESDLLDCQYMNVFGEHSFMNRKLESQRVYLRELKRAEKMQKKVVFAGHHNIGNTCMFAQEEKEPKISNENLLISPIDLKTLHLTDIPKNRRERRQREKEIRKNNKSK